MSCQLQVPSLGRPFNLGMLYNCYSNRLISGSALWNAEELKLKSTGKQQCSNYYQIITEDSIQNKFSTMSVDANLKLSVLSGLVNVDGAAKYLLDFNFSPNQARVTLHHTCTTHFEELLLEDYGYVPDSYVPEGQEATHVVSKIIYGTDAFFVFEKANESSKDELESIVLSSIARKNGEGIETGSISCKFYEDIKSTASTFNEAIDVFRNLLMITSGNKSIPKLVYLSPLSRRPQQIPYTISLGLVSQVEEVVENLHCTEMHIHEVKELSRSVCNMFSDIELQLSKLTTLFTLFKSNFKEKLSQLLPQIRRFEKDREKIAQLLSSVNVSPFNLHSIEKYLNSKCKEIELLYKLTVEKEVLNKLQFSSCMELMPDSNQVQHVVCLGFNVTSKTCGFIENLDAYIQTGKSKDDEELEWFDTPKITDQLESAISEFIVLVNNIPSTERVRFIVASSTKHFHDNGPSIVSYTAGNPFLLDLPGTPQATDITINSITLTWSAPVHSEISSYKILYSLKGKALESTESLGASLTHCIKGLCHGCEYQFKVQATTNFGLQLVSDVANVKTTEYFDIVLVGKTGQGKSTLGNKLLNLEKSDESKIQLFQLETAKATSAVGTASTSTKPATSDNTTMTPTSLSTGTPKRFLQGDDPEAKQSGHSDMLSITGECKLMANEDTKIRVLDVPGFSDSSTLLQLSKDLTVYNGNLQIVRWIVQNQLHSQLKVRRIVYFLPVRGPLEKADGIMQDELNIMNHYFGQDIFNCMVVVATNKPRKKFQDLGFDGGDFVQTKKVFHLALQAAVHNKNVDCPPIIYIGSNDTPEETLGKIKKAKVITESVISLKFKEDTCARCSVKISFNENKTPISVTYANGTSLPFAESKCHPSFLPKYSTVQKFAGGVAHIATLGIGWLVDTIVGKNLTWPGFTNSDEACIACKQSPGAEGCVTIGTEFTYRANDERVSIKTNHSSKM